MCTHACLLLAYCEGAGNVSMPFVEKVRWPLLKGSMRSGLFREVVGFSGGSLAAKKGPRDRRRIACAMVGWKRPPNCECALRWVGSVWPKVKKVDSPLIWCKQLDMEAPLQHCILVRKAKIVARQPPAQVVWVEHVAQRQNAPEYRIVHSASRLPLVAFEWHRCAPVRTRRCDLIL